MYTYSRSPLATTHYPDSEQGLPLIRRFEGFSPTAYLCPAGYLTIGYGHVVRSAEIFPPQGINAEQADALLAKDVADSERAVIRLIKTPLTDEQFSALVSFTFNLGAGALQRSALRRKVNSGQHADVPQEFMKWVWAGGRKLPGLIRRRAAEAALYADNPSYRRRPVSMRINSTVL